MGSSSGWLVRWTRTARSAPRPVAAVLLGTLVLACGEPEPEAQPQAEGQPTAPTPGVQPRQPEPRMKIGEAGTLPEDLPADLPIYPGAESTRWMSSKGSGTIVAFDSGDKPTAVYDFYSEGLRENGWTIESDASTDRRWSVVATKGAIRIRISIAASDEGTEFGIAVAEIRD